MIEINEYLLSGLVLVVILLSIAVVACMVKVVRLAESLQEHMDQVDRVHREMGLREEASNKLLRDTNRDINMVEKTLMNRINREHRKLTALENRLASDLDELASSASPGL